MAGKPKKSILDEFDLSQEIKENLSQMINDKLEKEIASQKRKNKKEYNILKKELSENKDSLKDVPSYQTNSVNSNYVPDSVQVRIKSNVDGKHLLMEHRGDKSYFIPFNDYEDIAQISFKQLRDLRAMKPSTLEGGLIAIVDAFTKDGEAFPINIIIKTLKLEKVYLDKTRFSPADIGYALSDECDIIEFRSKLTNSGVLQQTIYEIAEKLKKQGDFNDFKKISVFREIFAKPNLFN